jgi:hypothetical protein
MTNMTNCKKTRGNQATTIQNFQGRFTGERIVDNKHPRNETNKYGSMETPRVMEMRDRIVSPLGASSNGIKWAALTITTAIDGIKKNKIHRILNNNGRIDFGFDSTPT